MGDRLTASDYGPAVQARCLSDIERLTRFDQTSVDASVISAVPVTFEVTEAIRVVVNTSWRTDHGRTTGPGRVAGNKAEYQNLIAREEEVARVDEATTAAVLKTASTSAYGALADTWGLANHGVTVRWTYQCGSCSGAGETRCSTCGGDGQVNCGVCGGTRRMRCNSCGGSGGTVTHITESNGSFREERNPCIWCHGAGQRDCGSCAMGRVTCSNCGGRGKVKCNACGGHGELTNVTSFGRNAVLERTLTALQPRSERASEAVARQGLAALGAIAADHTATWTSQPGRVDGVTAFRTLSCELNLTSGDQTFKAFAFGDDGRIWDYGGLFEYLLGEDLETLEAASKGVKILAGSGDAAMRNAVAQFCESEAHQDLLTAAGRSLPWGETAKALNGTVSPAYVERSCWALGRFIGRLTLRQMALCAVLGFVGGFVVGVAGGAFLYFDNRVTFFAQGDWLFALPPLGLVVGLFVAWMRVGSYLRKLGGAPLTALAKRKDFGLFGRIGAAWRKPQAPNPVLSGPADEIDDEALARQAAPTTEGQREN